MISHGKDIKIFTGNANPRWRTDLQDHRHQAGRGRGQELRRRRGSVSLYETVRGSDVFVVQIHLQARQ